MLDTSTGSLIIAIVQTVFALALIPTVVNPRAQVPRASSGITAAGLWIIAIVYFFLDMQRAGGCASVTAAMWTFVFFYRPVLAVPAVDTSTDDDMERLFDHCARVIIASRDNVADAANESWRSLPMRLQWRIDERIQEIDLEAN